MYRLLKQRSFPKRDDICRRKLERWNRTAMNFVSSEFKLFVLRRCRRGHSPDSCEGCLRVRHSPDSCGGCLRVRHSPDSCEGCLRVRHSPDSCGGCLRVRLIASSARTATSLHCQVICFAWHKKDSLNPLITLLTIPLFWSRAVFCTIRTIIAIILLTELGPTGTRAEEAPCLLWGGK